ncbi:MAG: hypothetical protein DDT19_01587 [Syntrophomonadaceae bacterium]|nr:hypothetical protein [Bacillota bacterium]
MIVYGNTMHSTILLTIALGLSSISLSRIINRTWVSACTAYWLAWVLALSCAYYAGEKELIPQPSDISLSLIRVAHVGAFIGFFCATVVSGPVKRAIGQRQRNQIANIVSFTNKHYKPLLFIIFVVGLAHLAEALLKVGINPASLMADLRLSFLEGGLSPLGKLSAYIFTSLLLFSILFGLSDAFAGVRMRRIVLLTIVGATHGVAMGGRGFLLGIFLAYGASFLLASGITPGRKYYMDFKRRSLLYVGCVLAIFVLLGVWRWGVIGEDGNPFLIAINMITAWLGLSIPAVEPFVTAMADMPIRYGGYVFEWPVVQLERIGIIEGAIRSDNWDVVMMVRQTDGLVGNAPPTIIPSLVGDWGVSLMPIYLGVLMGLSHIATIRFRGMGLIGHVVSVMAILAAFYTIQSPAFLHSGNSLALIWTLAFLFLSKMFHGDRVRMARASGGRVRTVA